jgi:hypothetical protein
MRLLCLYVPEPVTNVGVNFLRSFLIISNGKTIRKKQEEEEEEEGGEESVRDFQAKGMRIYIKR